MSEIRVIFRNAGELLIGELVNETKEYLEFVDLAFVAIGQGQNQGQISLQFVPVDMLAIQPMPVPLKAILADQNEKPVFKLFKSQILNENVKIKDDIVKNYESARNPSPIITPDKSIVTPSNDNKVIKLFD